MDTKIIRSPERPVSKLTPLMFEIITPPKPIIQATIFKTVNFSCLKIRLAISIEKKAQVPSISDAFTPVVMERPM